MRDKRIKAATAVAALIRYSENVECGQLLCTQAIVPGLLLIFILHFNKIGFCLILCPTCCIFARSKFGI